MALTRRQKEVLDFLGKFLEEKGYSPSYEEVAEGMGLASLATVHKHISALVAKHYLRRGFNRSRSIDLAPEYAAEVRQRLERSAAAVRVPLAGHIAAGAPVEALEGKEELSFADFAGNEGTFALEVRGDSMIEDHICSGDYVLVEKTAAVRDGEIVVALVDGTETTLKRFFREPGGMARLQPANAAMDPIRVPLDRLAIQGRALAVLRKYR